MLTSPIGGAGYGWFPANIDVKVLASNAFTKGDCGQCDFLNATSVVPGNAASGFVKFKDPVFTDGTTTSEAACGVYGICLENIASGAYGMVRLRGTVVANVDSGCDVSKALLPATDGQLDPSTGGSGKKIIAIGLEADTSNLATVLFDGINGFGADGATNLST